jgi:arylformamidase
LPLHDISVLVSPDTPQWPGDTPFSCGWTWSIAKGDSVNVSTITSSPHVGTHADAPLHVADGWPASEAMSIESFIGPAVLLDLRSAHGVLELQALEDRIPPGTVRLLLRTGRSIAEGHFPESWPSLSAACAVGLAARGLRLLGADAPSVDQRESKSLGTHRAMFEHGGSIIENLDLRDVPEGRYELIALPLRWAGLDAVPLRAVLMTT